MFHIRASELNLVTESLICIPPFLSHVSLWHPPFYFASIASAFFMISLEIYSHMRSGIFAVLSVNKHVIVISDCSPPAWASKPWGNTGKKTRPAMQQPSDCSHSPWWAPGKLRMLKTQAIAQDSWDAYQRNDSNKPRVLDFPIHKKALNSLTWVMWFSLMNNSLLMFSLLVLCCKACIQSGSSPCFFRVTWDAFSRVWSPKNAHQIKHNFQLLGCKYLSQHIQ